MLKILISGAMDSETRGLENSLTDPVTVDIDGFRFTSGTIDGVKVTVRKTQMGKVNAALSTYIGVKHFLPDLIVNQGTAGAHSPALDVKDIIVGESIINVDSYKTEQKERGDGYDIHDRSLMGIEVRDGDEWMEVRELSSDPKLVTICMETPYSDGKLVRGIIGTGDGFNKEVDRIESIRNTFSTDCEEMESFAVAQVARNMNIPFIGFRVISNSQPKNLNFDERTAELCCRFSAEFIKKLSRNY
jgi:adenosylhomocysteine nucleosidase